MLQYDLCIHLLSRILSIPTALGYHFQRDFFRWGRYFFVDPGYTRDSRELKSRSPLIARHYFLQEMEVWMEMEIERNK